MKFRESVGARFHNAEKRFGPDFRGKSFSSHYPTGYESQYESFAQKKKEDDSTIVKTENFSRELLARAVTIWGPQICEECLLQN